MIEIISKNNKFGLINTENDSVILNTIYDNITEYPHVGYINVFEIRLNYNFKKHIYFLSEYNIITSEEAFFNIDDPISDTINNKILFKFNFKMFNVKLNDENYIYNQYGDFICRNLIQDHIDNILLNDLMNYAKKQIRLKKLLKI
jgi:hypothetical protein